MIDIIHIPKTVQSKLRSLLYEKSGDQTLKPFTTDIWYTDISLCEHTDSTAEGKNTIFTVLVNDADYYFMLGGKEIAIPVGATYRFNEREPHAVIKSSKITGRFAALIWDVPVEKQTSSLISEIKQRLRELLKVECKIEVIYE